MFGDFKRLYTPARFWQLILGSALAGGYGTVAAQASIAVDMDGQQLQRQQERERALRGALEKSPEVLAPQVESALFEIPVHETPCFPIRQLVLIGEHLDEVPWLGATSGVDFAAQSPCLGAKGIDVILQRMQQALVAHGLITSRVLVQPQNLSEGILTVAFVPGVIRHITVERTGDRAPRIANALPLPANRILQLRDIEQGMENLKRVPSVEADFEIVPAQGADAQPGQSDLVLKYQAGRPVRLNVALDDGGTTSTGKVQATATLSVDSPLSLNDLFYASFGSGVANGQGRGTDANTLHYAVPWGYWLLGLTASRNQYHQTVAGASQPYVYSGESRNAELQLSRILHRGAAFKTTGGIRAFRRASNSYIDDTEIEVQRRVTAGYELSLHHHHLLGQAVVDASLALRRGTGAFGAIEAPEQQWGEGTSRMRLSTADLKYTQPLQLFGTALRASSHWHGQWNSTPLTPQDRLSIGGRYTVRGFDGEVTLFAERGWYWRNELAMPVRQGMEAYLALDAGHVSGPSAASLQGRSLAGGAWGVRGVLGGVSYDVFIGRPVHKPRHFKTANTTFGVSLSTSF